MTAILPSPFPWKGVTMVRARNALPVSEWLPTWGGPAEAT